MKLKKYMVNSVFSDIIRIIYITIPAALIYDLIISNYMGYAEEGFTETLIIYFMGANKIDTVLLTWLFLQTYIIGICIYTLKKELNCFLTISILKLKSVNRYINYLVVRMAWIIITFYCVIFGFTVIYVKVFHNTLRATSIYSKYLNIGADINCFLLFSNIILNTSLYIILICILGIVLKSFSNGFLMLQIYQLFALFTTNKVYSFRYFPLTQGGFIFFDSIYTYKFAAIYQIFMIICSVLLLTKLFKKNIENYL